MLVKLHSIFVVWKGKNIFIVDRVTMINSVMSSLPLFFFSFYRAPESVIEKMTNI